LLHPEFSYIFSEVVCLHYTYFYFDLCIYDCYEFEYGKEQLDTFSRKGSSIILDDKIMNEMRDKIQSQRIFVKLYLNYNPNLSDQLVNFKPNQIAYSLLVNEFKFHCNCIHTLKYIFSTVSQEV